MSCNHEWVTVSEDTLVENHREFIVQAELVCKKCRQVAIAFARNVKGEEE